MVTPKQKQKQKKGSGRKDGPNGIGELTKGDEGQGD